MIGTASVIESAPRAIGVTVTDDTLTVDLGNGRFSPCASHPNQLRCFHERLRN